MQIGGRARSSVRGSVTETEPLAAVQNIDVLAATAKLDSDKTGAETFARYIWQAKQAVRLWLTCLSAQGGGPLVVVCEHVEDITLIYAESVRFLQLKTRDRGSWSASLMCDKGVRALFRSYEAARDAGLHARATFELWLEGPMSDASETTAFVENPMSATSRLRSKITGVRPKRGWLDDFLQRLVIRPDQPTRAHIDATVLWEMGALWPAMSRPELSHVYERLLSAATAAQAASPAPPTIQAHLVAARPYFAQQLPAGEEPGGTTIDAIRAQILSHAMLVALTPPLPTEPVEQLLARMSAGSSNSLLELKMVRAGARAETIQRVQELRAGMEIERQMLLASRDAAEADLERLAVRTLTVAEAMASRIAMSAASNPAAAARPAEAIAADLLSHPADLGQCDRGSLFGGDGLTVCGYLGHLSDTCRFAWRAA
jgi:hypothetical protein